MTRDVETPDVVVIGAGPTGVTAAILLSQSGVRTLVLDRWTDVFPQPRAVHLDDEVFRILAGLGVADEFAKISIAGKGLRLLSADHQTLVQFDRTDPQTSNGYPQANMFDQPDLEALLRRRMLELDLVSFRGNVEVTAVRVDVAGGPEVEYLDRETQQTHLVRPRFVFGCDGANSLVREAIGSRMQDLGFPEQRWLVVDIATPRNLGHWDGVHQICDSRRAATYMRIGETRHRWEFELLAGESAADYATPQALAPLLAPWDTDLSDFEVLRATEYTFRAQLADAWRRGNVFILGDAAHLTPPFIGQGMGAGIRDAANLSWKVAAVINGTLPARVLASYETERKPHARSMIKLATTVGHAMTGGGRVGDRLRTLLVPWLVRLPGMRRKVLESVTPALASSELCNRRGVLAHLPGTLCPNVILDSGERFDAVIGPRFALVTRDAFDQPASDFTVVAVSRAPGLASWLGRHHAALVRPDRTVFAAGTIEHVLGLAPFLRPPTQAPRQATPVDTPRSEVRW